MKKKYRMRKASMCILRGASHSLQCAKRHQMLFNVEEYPGVQTDVKWLLFQGRLDERDHSAQLV